MVVVGRGRKRRGLFFGARDYDKVDLIVQRARLAALTAWFDACCKIRRQREIKRVCCRSPRGWLEVKAAGVRNLRIAGDNDGGHRLRRWARRGRGRRKKNLTEAGGRVCCMSIWEICRTSLCIIPSLHHSVPDVNRSIQGPSSSKPKSGNLVYLASIYLRSARGHALRNTINPTLLIHSLIRGGGVEQLILLAYHA